MTVNNGKLKQAVASVAAADWCAILAKHSPQDRTWHAATRLANAFFCLPFRKRIRNVSLSWKKSNSIH